LCGCWCVISKGNGAFWMINEQYRQRSNSVNSSDKILFGMKH